MTEEQAANPTSESGQTPPAPEAEQTTERPEWAANIPENLLRDTPEETLAALSKSYKSAVDLAKKRQSEDGLGIGEGKNDGKPAKKQPGSFSDILEDAGIDPDELASTISEKGKPSRSQYEKLAAKGFPKAVVDEFIEGQQSRAQLQQFQRDQMVESAYSEAGGPDEYKRLTEWGGENLDAETIQWLNSQLDGPGANKTSVRAAVRFLKTESGSSKPGRPADATGGGAPKSGTKGYSTRAEFRQAVQEMQKRSSQGLSVNEIAAAIAATPKSIREGNHR